MNRNKFSIVLVASLLSLYTSNSIAETRNVDVNYHRSVDGHSENINRDYHVNNRNDDARFNNSEHFNNDTFNIDRNREVFNTSNVPYRGWNQGPIGMGNGWDNGWNHGYENGGWGTGLVEGLIGGIAATSLFNYFFNHNSTPTVAYVNGGGSSSGGSYNTNVDSQPSEEITNNTTTNNTVIDDGGSNVGYWLLGLGLLALGAIAIIYFLRRPRQGNSMSESYGSNYIDDQPEDYRDRFRSRSNYKNDSAQLDNQELRHRVPTNLRNPRTQRRRD